jgi:hypothetical protein
MTSAIVSMFHCQQGLLMIENLPCKTPKQHSTSFLHASCRLAK